MSVPDWQIRQLIEQQQLLTNFDLANIDPSGASLCWSGRRREPVMSQERWGPVLESDEIEIYQHDFLLLDTMEYINIPNDYCALLMLKSSAARNGLDITKPDSTKQRPSIYYEYESSDPRFYQKSDGLHHSNAGFFDPGFSGTATLEVTNFHKQSVILKKGQPIVQLVFFRMEGRPDKSYKVTGRYNEQNTPEGAR